MFFQKNKNINNEKKHQYETNKISVALINKNNKKHSGTKHVPNNDDFIIELDNIEKSFVNDKVINYVLKGISLKIKKGSLVVILGKSGSGKTTLMNIISGLIRATNGSSIVAGQNLINLTNGELTQFRREKIGYIFQEYGLLESLTVYENIKAGYNLSKYNINKNSKDSINSLLKSVNLYEHRKKFPYELSGGQQQRVAICRALAKEPQIIFGDEPTGALDSEMSILILNLLTKVNKENGTTIIIITHDKEIAKIADYIYVIKDGLLDNSYQNINIISPSDLYKEI